MEKIYNNSNAMGRRSEYRKRLDLRKRRALIAPLERKKMSAFVQGLLEGIDMPLSLDIPKLGRERLGALRVEPTIRGPRADRINLCRDMRRAAEYALKTTR